MNYYEIATIIETAFLLALVIFGTGCVIHIIKIERKIIRAERRLKEKDDIISQQDAKMEQMEKDIKFLKFDNEFHKPFEIKRTTIPFKTYICEAFDRQLDAFRFDIRNIE